MTLEVGCGHSLKGDVNVDLYVKATAHRSLDQRRIDDTDLDVKHIPNFVCADACHLPFKNDSFEEVVSSHTLEHTNGELMFSEMVRVSNRLIRVVCPNQFGANRRLKVLHTYVVNKTWFDKAAQKYGVQTISVTYSNYKYFPHVFFHFIAIPIEITFIGLKKGRPNR